jgi:hypothetical protein
MAIQDAFEVKIQTLMQKPVEINSRNRKGSEAGKYKKEIK